MKNKEYDKSIINNINYSKNEISKKIIKNIKISNILFFLNIILGTVIYIIGMFTIVKTKGIVFFTLLYMVIIIDLSISHRRYLDKVLEETLYDCINPETYIDINLYNANKKICNEKVFNNSLNNIAYALIQLGDFKKAKKILKYLDNRKKDLILQSNILNNKIEIAFFENNTEELKKEVEQLKNVIKFLPKKNKNIIMSNIKLRQAIINNDTDEVNNICNLLEKNKKLLYKIQAEYFRGLLKEKINDNSFTINYTYVAENGNNLYIAKTVREKLNYFEEEKNYKKKSHIFYKTIQIITLIIFLLITNFLTMYMIFLINK